MLDENTLQAVNVYQVSLVIHYTDVRNPLKTCVKMTLHVKLIKLVFLPLKESKIVLMFALVIVAKLALHVLVATIVLFANVYPVIHDNLVHHLEFVSLIYAELIQNVQILKFVL